MNLFFMMRQQNSILRAVVSIAVGIVFIAVPGLTISFLISLIGSILLILGAISIVSYYTKKVEEGVRKVIPYGAIISVVGGLILIFKPIVFVNLFTILLGLMLLLGCIGQLMSISFFTRYTKLHPGIYITPILIGICGILLLVDPFSSTVVMITIFGISILVYGIMELVAYFKFKNIEKNNS